MSKRDVNIEKMNQRHVGNGCNGDGRQNPAVNEHGIACGGQTAFDHCLHARILVRNDISFLYAAEHTRCSVKAGTHPVSAIRPLRVPGQTITV